MCDLYHAATEPTPKEFYKKNSIWCETLKMINEAILRIKFYCFYNQSIEVVGVDTAKGDQKTGKPVKYFRCCAESFTL